MPRPANWISIGGLALLSFGLGFLSHRERLLPADLLRAAWRSVTGRGEPVEAPLPNGFWSPTRAQTGTATAPSAAAQERLLSIPYVAGRRPAEAGAGVTRHVPGAAFEGVNLYVSGHAPRATLMDMSGRVLHTWQRPLAQTFPAWPAQPSNHYWRRARLLEGGALLVVHDYIGIARLEADSRLAWTYSGSNHHDLDIGPQGDIYVLGRRARPHPRRAGALIADDTITVLDASGRLRDEFSLYDCLQGSDYAALLEYMEPEGDVFHANTLTVLDGSLERSSPHFRKGNLLVAIRNLNAIAVVDPVARRVVWALAGLWVKPHEPVLLASGRMLIFDNNAGHGHSRVVEFDPSTQQTHWQYRGGPGSPFYSELAGTAQRLPNGNTLIVESTEGRAFEVRTGGDVVWEFRSPHRVGSRRELVAVLFDLVRLDLAAPELSFLARGATRPR